MKTALITGGSRGIGRACVEAFVQEGYKVAFVYRQDGAGAEQVAQQTGALAVKADVSQRQELMSSIARIQDSICPGSGFDAVVINAGIWIPGLVQDVTEEEWADLRGTNLDGALYTAQAVAPAMISSGKGSITFISSVWGQRGAAMESCYSATKAGLLGLSDALAKELGPSGIRVNALCPGVIDTDMNKGYSPEELADLFARTPLGRMGQPEEVAQAAVFLASEKASFITGQTLGIDGGFVV